MRWCGAQPQHRQTAGVNQTEGPSGLGMINSCPVKYPG